MKGTCPDIFMFPSHAGDMQYPRPMAILWEATSRHIERAIRHDDVARQIIRKELESVLDLWTYTIWELPVSIFGETNEGMSLMTVTRQLRRAAHRWREMSGDWQMESEQLSWELTRDQWHTLGGFQKSVTRAARLLWDKGIRDVRTLTRESLSPALRPSLPQQLLFLEENLGNPQDTFYR